MRGVGRLLDRAIHPLVGWVLGRALGSITEDELNDLIESLMPSTPSDH
jgi:hypothetical protein